MSKLTKVLALMGVIVMLSYSIATADSYNTVTVKLKNPITGALLSCNDFDNENLSVSLHLDSDLIFEPAWYISEDCSRIIFQNVPKGYYDLRVWVVNWQTSTWRSIYNGGAPSERTSSLLNLTSSASTSPKTFYLRPGGYAPQITDVSVTSDDTGADIYTITGLGFGDKKGWVSLDGKVTKAPSVVLSWSDSVVQLRSSKPIINYLGICPKYYGCMPVFNHSEEMSPAGLIQVPHATKQKKEVRWLMNRPIYEEITVCPTCHGHGVLDCTDAYDKVFKGNSPCGCCPCIESGALVECGAVECPTCEGMGYFVELR